MNTARTCPQCHQPMPEDAPEGLCPQCLMKELAAATNILPPGSTPSRDTVDIGDAAEVAKRLPQFEILELLGRGGMGVVYKARQVQLERLVALKILPPEDSRSPDFVERFRREARSLAKLSHPNIVNVHDFGEGGGLYYIVMEFVEGANLRQMIQSKQLSPAEALAIVPKICDALQFAHEEGVMHRDIKPENILVDKKGRVKIADFGLAKLLHRDPAEALLTMSGMTLGTPRYMAPEQMDKPESVDHRADIYSLGVVFYEMLTGEVPMGRFAPPSQKVQVDVRFDEIVLHAMERDVERRYQHVSEVKTDVENATHHSTRASESSRVPMPKESDVAAATYIPVVAPELREKIKGAGVLLIVAGIAIALSGLIAFIHGSVMAFRYATIVTHPGDDVATRAAAGAFVMLAMCLIGIAVFVGGVSMRKLRFHGFVLAMSILLMALPPVLLLLTHALEWIAPQLAFGLYAGIKTFRLLRRHEVETAFGLDADKPSEWLPAMVNRTLALLVLVCVVAGLTHIAQIALWTRAHTSYSSDASGRLVNPVAPNPANRPDAAFVILDVLAALVACGIAARLAFRKPVGTNQAVAAQLPSQEPLRSDPASAGSSATGVTSAPAAAASAPNHLNNLLGFAMTPQPGYARQVGIPMMIITGLWMVVMLAVTFMVPQEEQNIHAITLGVGLVGIPLGLLFLSLRWAVRRGKPPAEKGDANQPNGIGTISLWMAIGGLVLPALLALGAQWNSSVHRLPNFYSLCFILGMVMELIALVCGIVARRSGSGKAGATIGATSLVLAILLVPMTTLHTRVSDQGPVETITRSAMVIPPLGPVTSGVGAEFTVPAGQVATFEIVTRKDGATVPVPPLCAYVLATPDRPAAGTFLWSREPERDGANSRRAWRIELNSESGNGSVGGLSLPDTLDTEVGSRSLALGNLESNAETIHWGGADANNLPANGLIGLRVTVVTHGLSTGGSGVAHIDWKKAQTTKSSSHRKLE